MMQIPFLVRRPRSRWDRLIERMGGTDDLVRRLLESEPLREALDETAGLRRRVQPLVERAYARRPDLSFADAPAFLHDRLPLDQLRRLAHRPTRTERLMQATAPVWLIAGAALAGVVLGYALGAAGARRRGRARVDLEAASERIKSTWPNIHDDDIRDARGNVKKLSKVIVERTGEDQQVVRERLVELAGSVQSTNGHHE
jgi:hypothetical protein